MPADQGMRYRSRDDASDGRVVGSSSARLRERSAMSEVWDWYKYHADQRLKSFNFFIVFVGGLFVLLGSTFTIGRPLLARLACALAVLLSLGFALLDVRNARLVDIAAEAIVAGSPNLADVIEQAHRDAPGWKDLRLFHRNRGLATNLTRHRFVLRAIMLLTAAIFLCIAIIGPR